MIELAHQNMHKGDVQLMKPVLGVAQDARERGMRPFGVILLEEIRFSF